MTDDETEQVIQITKTKLEILRKELNDDISDDEFKRIKILINDQLFILHICEDLLRWSEYDREQRLA